MTVSSSLYPGCSQRDFARDLKPKVL